MYRAVTFDRVYSEIEKGFDVYSNCIVHVKNHKIEYILRQS